MRSATIIPAMATILATSSGITPEMFEPRKYWSPANRVAPEQEQQDRIAKAELKRQQRAERNLRNRPIRG